MALLWALAALLFGNGNACTNFIVTRGATSDQSTIFANTADAGGLHGALPHFPRARHAPGSRRKLLDTDTGRLLGEIDEVPQTYNVIGNLNEHGVAIGETKFGGNATLAGGQGIMDYGNLIWVTLQRTKTAFQAVQMFGALVEQYGYISEGVSFTIADPGEAWILEMVGKGRYEPGAVWVAVRIPEGHISGHAGQARIQRFPMDSPLECVFSKDVVSFAGKIGLWDASRPSTEFSFAEAYDPLAFREADESDARIWAFFSVVGNDATLTEAFAKQASMGGRQSSRARLPLSIQARSKISVLDLMKHMRNHYTGTSLYQEPAIGMISSQQGAEGARPKHWQFSNTSIVHSRRDGTQEGGWNFVAQLRGHYPAPIGGVLWFGIDDATFTVHIPIHGGTTRVPKAFRDGDETYWAFNAAAQFINPRWSLAPAVLKRAHSMEEDFQQELLTEEWKAWQLYQAEPAKAMELLTAQEEERARKATKAEFALLGGLMAHFTHGAAGGTASAGIEEADMHHPGRGEEMSAEDLAELKAWFVKMAQQVRSEEAGGATAQAGRLEVQALFEKPWGGRAVEPAARSTQHLGKVVAAVLSSIAASAVLAFVLTRLRQQRGQHVALEAEEPLAMDLWAIEEETIE